MEWRAKLEKEPTLLQPFQIEEIVRAVRARCRCEFFFDVDSESHVWEVWPPIQRKPKLGKGTKSVRSRLRRLPQNDVWEAVSVVTATDQHFSGEKP